jgi:hypothetical protein
MGAVKTAMTLASLPVNSECEISDIIMNGSTYIVSGYYTTNENEEQSYLVITEKELDKYLSEYYSIEEVKSNTKNGKYIVMTDGEGENATFIPLDQFIDENKYDFFYNLIKEQSGKF